MLMIDDFFDNRLNQLIDLSHPLAVLVNRKPWQEIDAIVYSSYRGVAKDNQKLDTILP
jgi:IS5 family transposase